VVLYRGEDGRAIALEDRCCHRAAPLSFGRREGENLRCMYHGLLFDPTGQCIEVPNHDRVPHGFRVRSYPIEERHRLIWIWPGDPAKADRDAIPDTHWLDDAGWRAKTGYLRYQANYRLIVDNLLDFSHLTYVHPTTLGSPAIAAAMPEVERNPTGLRITRSYPSIEPVPFHAKVGGFTGKVDMWQIYDWFAPSMIQMDAGSAPAGEGAPEKRPPGAIEFRHHSMITPETERTSHYFFAQPRNFGLEDAALDDTVLGQVLTAFNEDRRMIESQQRVIDATPESPLRTMASDLAVVQARRHIDAMLAAET
jgi:phenylpropionate dioxygenase-like ring-hydroxylating dioxygenase large terminal subunit